VAIHDENGENPHLYIEAKHEERTDEHGYISRQFSRRIALPADCDAKKLECNWSDNNGVLSVKAPRKALPAAQSSAKGRAIPINTTPAIKEGGKK